LNELDPTYFGDTPIEGIKLFRKGHKNEPVTYHGKGDLLDVVAFIEQQRGYARVLDESFLFFKLICLLVLAGIQRLTFSAVRAEMWRTGICARRTRRASCATWRRRWVTTTCTLSPTRYYSYISVSTSYFLLLLLPSIYSSAKRACSNNVV
jgi:hypothetical protein